MPRFFFHDLQPERREDRTGVELASAEAARAELVHLAGDTLRHLDHPFWARPHWQVEVRDEDGFLVCGLKVEAWGAP